MHYFETLRATLLSFAKVPVKIDYSDPRYIPVREDKVDADGFHFQSYGQPHNYTMWISPYLYHNNVSYMGLEILKIDDEIERLIFSVCSTSAGMTYKYVFHFIDGMPNVEMYQGRGANVTGERVHFEKVRCINFVIFDLIKLMLPPQIAAHAPQSTPDYHLMVDKPCFVCEFNTIPHNWEVCSDCYNNVPLAVG